MDKILKKIGTKIPILSWYFRNKELTEENLRLTMFNDELIGKLLATDNKETIKEYRKDNINI